MTLDHYFIAANAVALAGWAALLAAPLNRPTLVAAARVAGAVLAMSYLVLFVATLGDAGFAVDYSLPGIARFFDVPGFVLVGWIHYLAFDLWIGSWEVEQAGEARMSHALLIPCLLLTYLLGPIGLLLFLVTRALGARRTRR